ncbi:hypothetical protein CVIRNUC_007624 [Coccomyxa viridis]|uniref:Guanine nucleotide-binding protein subunit beta-like protein n=1 Tax=Coccomyxa viridis TaxID=1274662 RepID=A0AAV1ID79_9CHLO|nr:hypothetical protein CVIRNUC_007624 [Coccomyxa viridis]
MRIRIDIDVADHELDVATELLTVLRSITDEINVRHQGAVMGGASISRTPAADTHSVKINGPSSSSGLESVADAKASVTGGLPTAFQKAPASPAASSSATVFPGSPPLSSQVQAQAGAFGSVLQTGSRPGSRAGSQLGPRAGSASSSTDTSGLPPSARPPPAAAPSAAQLPGPGAAPAAPAAPGARSAAPAPKPVRPPRGDIVAALRKLIAGLDSEADYEANLTKVSTNLGKVFETGNLGAEAFGIFWDAFSSILWDPERLKAQQSVVNFMNLLPGLPEDILAKTKEPLISQTMRRLTESRPVDANRQEFFTDAEIFACITTMHLVALTGAVKTIIQMLGSEQKRAAAVTMLGKTVEQSADQLKTEVDNDTLAALKAAVDKIKEPIFQYDKSYVYECMDWGVPPSCPVTPANGKLMAHMSYKGHSAPVFAVGYDHTHSQLASAGRDSSVILWDSSGKQIDRVMGVPGSCYGGMAMHPERPVMAAVCMGEVKPPYVDILDLRQGSLKRRLQLQCSSAELVSCVTCLPGSDRFATGELHANDQGAVAIYDLNSLSSSTADAVATLNDEHGTVTCIGTLDTGTANPNVLMSGARDGTITVWDLRENKPVMHMHVPATSSDNPSAPAVDPIVTCFDSKECVILAGSINTNLCQWDVRRLTAGANPPQELTVLDGSAILRIAFGPAAPTAAISTLNGLYYMDPFAEGVHPSYRMAEAFPNKAKQQYPDVKWGSGQDASMLYAACLDGSVDVYKLD